MKTFLILTFIFLYISAFAYTPENVFIIANSNSKNSLELADFYAKKRNIPKVNIIKLDVKETPRISRADYNNKVAIPIYTALKKAKKVSALNGTNIPTQALVVKSDVDAFVVCKGIPFIIDPEIDEMKVEKKNYIKNDAAALDSELTMLLQGNYPLLGFQKNPAYGLDLTLKLAKNLKLIPIARLDGPSYKAAKSVLESALIAEAKGIRGRTYIDKSKKYKDGDELLLRTQKLIENEGFDSSTDNEAPCMNYTQRMDAPVFYFGWYTSSPIGYFKSKDMYFASGASTQHIYSWSATNLSNISATWTPNLVSHKAAVSFGYVYEPFLMLTHNSEEYIKSIFKKNNVSVAILASQRGLSWQNIAIADPLFKPLKYDLESQLSDIKNGKIDELSQYVIVRKMNLIAKSESKENALNFAEKYSPALPINFALLWKISQFKFDIKLIQESVTFAKKALVNVPFEFQNYGLIFEICAFLESQNEAQFCVDFYKKIIEKSIDENNSDFLKVVLPYTLKRLKLDDSTSEAYKLKIEELTPSPTSKK